jgi:hypothetical protein
MPIFMVYHDGSYDDGQTAVRAQTEADARDAVFEMRLSIGDPNPTIYDAIEIPGDAITEDEWSALPDEVRGLYLPVEGEYTYVLTEF